MLDIPVYEANVTWELCISFSGLHNSYTHILASLAKVGVFFDPLLHYFEVKPYFVGITSYTKYSEVKPYSHRVSFSKAFPCLF
jgi:hypothetical protein